MAGICYNKSGTMTSLTGPEYTDIQIPSGAKTLYIRTGTNVSDKIVYGLTTDTSASEYSPSINVSGTTMYIAKQGTVESEVYHTDTRASTSKTDTIYTQTSTVNVVYTSRTYSGNETLIKISREMSYSAKHSYMEGLTTSLTSKVSENGTLPYLAGSSFGSGTIAKNTISTKLVRYNVTQTTKSPYITYAADTMSFTAKNSANTMTTLFAINTSNYLYSITGKYTITTGSKMQESYLTRKSTYTSRTETITVTTGNIYREL